MINATLDFNDWLDPHTYSSQWKASEASTVGIKTARYFLISKRESDGAVVFWYKPNTAHSTLYPVKRNAANEPVTVTFQGQERYVTDPRGIEIFNSVKGPGAPPSKVASFGAHKDKSPYLNVGKTLEAIMKLITIHEPPSRQAQRTTASRNFGNCGLQAVLHPQRKSGQCLSSRSLSAVHRRIAGRPASRSLSSSRSSARASSTSIRLRATA